MRSRRSTAVLFGGACAGVVAVLTVVGATAEDPQREVVVNTGQASSGAVPAPATSSGGEQPAETAAPLLVNNADCRYVVAYEIAAAAYEVGPGSSSALYINAERDLAGGMASLTFLDERVDAADLSNSGVQPSITSFPDGTAIIEWADEERPLAFLSAKRISGDQLEALARGISEGSDAPGGYVEIAPPESSAVVYGSSCDIAGNFIGVEVVAGDFAAQLAYAINTDPSTVDSHDSFAVLTFNRQDEAAPVPVREAGQDEWRTLVVSSQLETDQP